MLLSRLRMRGQRITSPLITLVFAAAAVHCATAGPPDAQRSSDPQKATARLWRDPTPIARRDLRWGSGSDARAPRPPFKFVEEDLGGSQPKVTVTDVNGVTWAVKFGIEVSSELASNRIIWALGYLVEEMYYVPSGTIQGVTE